MLLYAIIVGFGVLAGILTNILVNQKNRVYSVIGSVIILLAGAFACFVLYYPFYFSNYNNLIITLVLIAAFFIAIYVGLRLIVNTVMRRAGHPAFADTPANSAAPVQPKSIHVLKSKPKKASRKKTIGSVEVTRIGKASLMSAQQKAMKSNPSISGSGGAKAVQQQIDVALSSSVINTSERVVVETERMDTSRLVGQSPIAVPEKTAEVPQISAAGKVSEELQAAIAEEIAEELPAIAAEEMAEEPQNPVAEEIAEELPVTAAEEMTEETQTVIAEEMAEEQQAPVAEEVAEEPQTAIAEEIAEEPQTPVAEEIAEELPVTAAEEMAEETQTVIAEEMAEEQQTPVAEEIAEEPQTAIAEEIAEEPQTAIDEEITEEPQAVVIQSVPPDRFSAVVSKAGELISQGMYNYASELVQACLDQSLSTDQQKHADIILLECLVLSNQIDLARKKWLEILNKMYILEPVDKIKLKRILEELNSNHRQVS